MFSNNPQQSPLDEFLQQNSIMYKGTNGNQFNTSIDNYYIERDGYSPQTTDGDIWPINPDCNECQWSNPPWWCTYKLYLPDGSMNPEHPCYGHPSVPIDGALPLLMLAGMVLAMFSFKSRTFA